MAFQEKVEGGIGLEIVCQAGKMIGERLSINSEGRGRYKGFVFDANNESERRGGGEQRVELGLEFP